jgi:hypothetical protein
MTKRKYINGKIMCILAGTKAFSNSIVLRIIKFKSSFDGATTLSIMGLVETLIINDTQQRYSA